MSEGDDPVVGQGERCPPNNLWLLSRFHAITLLRFYALMEKIFKHQKYKFKEKQKNLINT